MGGGVVQKTAVTFEVINRFNRSHCKRVSLFLSLPLSLSVLLYDRLLFGNSFSFLGKEKGIFFFKALILTVNPDIEKCKHIFKKSSMVIK